MTKDGDVLDRKRKMPLYEQLRLVLQDKILMGDSPKGSLLPTEQELCNKYKVSRITVRKAVDGLERAGLVERVQGKGTLIRGREVGQSNIHIQGYQQSMRSQGFVVDTNLLKKRIVGGNPELESLFELNLEREHQFWLFRRLRYLNGDPAVIMNSFVRKELGDKMLKYDLSSVSFYGCYEEITGRLVVDNRALITAVSASHQTAELLNTKVGAPLIWFRGVSYLEGNFPVEVCYSLFLGDQFQFQTNIYRVREVDLIDYNDL